MIIQWVGDIPMADAEAIAALYEVSPRTVRRRCIPTGRIPRKGSPRGVGGRALYDAYTAAAALEGVAARPDRTLAGLRRLTAQQQHAKQTGQKGTGPWPRSSDG